MKGLKPRFFIGSTIEFGDDPWKVVRYHKIGEHHEVMFCSTRGEHRSLPIYQLERVVRQEEKLLAEKKAAEKKAAKKKVKK